MKVIFLDIDGVLNSAEFFHRRFEERGNRAPSNLREHDQLDPDGIRCLNTIIERTGARIVISSTWRLRNDFRQVIRLLKRQGLKGHILGRTPRLSGEGIVRGHEIAAWLFSQIDWPEGIVILDDDSDMAHLMPWLVKTSNDMGLCVPDIDRAVEMLNRPGWQR
jgi:hypothetical protein